MRASPDVTAAATTRTDTSSWRGLGLGISTARATCRGPYLSTITARIVTTWCLCGLGARQRSTSADGQF
jgi:hypothetical protein